MMGELRIYDFIEMISVNVVEKCRREMAATLSSFGD